MKTFREQLNIAERAGLDIFDLVIGFDVEDELERAEVDFEDEFERICSLTKDIQLELVVELDSSDIARAIIELRKKGLSYEDIIKNNYRLVVKNILGINP